jgi:hypothetical protein
VVIFSLQGRKAPTPPERFCRKAGEKEWHRKQKRRRPKAAALV